MAVDDHGLETIKKAGRERTPGDKSDYILQVNELGGKLVPEEFDEISLTYVAAGNGTGEIQTVIYELNSVTVATLTLGYDVSDRLNSVVRT